MAKMSYLEKSTGSLLGDINGSNTVFTVTEATPDGGEFWAQVNAEPTECTMSGQAFTLAIAPLPGDTVSIWYTANAGVVPTPTTPTDFNIGVGFMPEPA